MRYSKRWAAHSLDDFRGSFMDRSGATLVHATAECGCGIAEPHRHCSHCGRLASIGTGEVIATIDLMDALKKNLKINGA